MAFVLDGELTIEHLVNGNRPPGYIFFVGFGIIARCLEHPNKGKKTRPSILRKWSRMNRHSRLVLHYKMAWVAL